MRKRGVRSACDNRVERGPLEPGRDQPPIDRLRDFALRSAAPHFVEDAVRDAGQQPRGLAQHRQLVLVFAKPQSLHHVLERDELRRAGVLRQRRGQPVVAADGDVCRLEPDARRAKRRQQLHERRVVRPLDDRQLEIGARIRRVLHRVERGHVAEIGNEVDTLAGDDGDRGAAGKIRQVQNVRSCRDD